MKRLIEAQIFGILILSPTYGYKPTVVKCEENDELGKWYSIDPKQLSKLEKAGFVIKTIHVSKRKGFLKLARVG